VKRAKVHPLSVTSPVLKWFSDELSWSGTLNIKILYISNYTNNCDSYEGNEQGKDKEVTAVLRTAIQQGEKD